MAENNENGINPEDNQVTENGTNNGETVINNGVSEEPQVPDFSAEYEAMRSEIAELHETVKCLRDNISTFVEAGATVVEPSNTGCGGEEDEEEKFIRLEDMDFSM
jgi:hypothetical protein